MKIEELWNQEKEPLIEDLRLSSSRVSSYDQNGPSVLLERKKLSGEGILMGGLIDLLLFEPDKFNDNYYVFSAIIPTASAKVLADFIVNSCTEVPTIDRVLEYVKICNLWKSVVNKYTLIGKFDTPDFWDYLKAEFESIGKTIISQENLDNANDIIDVLQSHSYSKDIVSYPEENEDKYAQLEINFRYKQFAFKGVIDLVIVDHKNKTIKLIDLKTGTPSGTAFTTSFLKYRYYLQALLYTIGVTDFISKYKLEGYEVLSFEFLYISRYERIPLIYRVPSKWLTAAKKGFTTLSGYKNKGLDELLDEIDWHWTNKEFKLTKEIVEQKGEILINDEFIVVNE